MDPAEFNKKIKSQQRWEEQFFFLRTFFKEIFQNF